MPLCTTCMEWYSVPSRMARTCRKCEGEQIAEAAKELDSKALSIAAISSWVVFKSQPKSFRRAWKAS